MPREQYCPKTLNQGPQDDKQGRSIPNQVGNPNGELYCYIFQTWVPWDERVLEKMGVNYSNFTIVQAFNRKQNLEEIRVKREKVTITSVDAFNMYPSIKLLVIRKAVNFFTKGLTPPCKEIICQCLEIIGFRMSSTLISFDGKYY